MTDRQWHVRYQAGAKRLRAAAKKGCALLVVFTKNGKLRGYREVRLPS